eukprot:TRINITY_DN19129_c0_g1_i1.p1 TRINITY_DN19129_c0_g1~~TRINITY_DN19129_c0_g1_i1.p1  ORF type:complete len:706 (-),score=147.17 TRINITY_DN19129_c0_g1_i1:62-2179(-)
MSLSAFGQLRQRLGNKERVHLTLQLTVFDVAGVPLPPTPDGRGRSQFYVEWSDKSKSPVGRTSTKQPDSNGVISFSERFEWRCTISRKKGEAYTGRPVKFYVKQLGRNGEPDRKVGVGELDLAQTVNSQSLQLLASPSKYSLRLYCKRGTELKLLIGVQGIDFVQDETDQSSRAEGGAAIEDPTEVDDLWDEEDEGDELEPPPPERGRIASRIDAPPVRSNSAGSTRKPLTRAVSVPRGTKPAAVSAVARPQGPIVAAVESSTDDAVALYEAQLRQKDADFHAAESRLMQRDTELLAAQLKVAQKESDLRSALDLVEQRGSEIERLRNELALLQAKFTREVDDVREQYNDKEAEVESYARAMETKDRDLKRKDDELRALKIELADAQRERDWMTQRLQAAEDGQRGAGFLQTELEDAKRQLAQNERLMVRKLKDMEEANERSLQEAQRRIRDTEVRPLLDEVDRLRREGTDGIAGRMEVAELREEKAALTLRCAEREQEITVLLRKLDLQAKVVEEKSKGLAIQQRIVANKEEHIADLEKRLATLEGKVTRYRSESRRAGDRDDSELARKLQQSEEECATLRDLLQQRNRELTMFMRSSVTAASASASKRKDVLGSASKSRPIQADSSEEDLAAAPSARSSEMMVTARSIPKNDPMLRRVRRAVRPAPTPEDAESSLDELEGNHTVAYARPAVAVVASQWMSEDD